MTLINYFSLSKKLIALSAILAINTICYADPEDCKNPDRNALHTLCTVSPSGLAPENGKWIKEEIDNSYLIISCWDNNSAYYEKEYGADLLGSHTDKFTQCMDRDCLNGSKPIGEDKFEVTHQGLEYTATPATYSIIIDPAFGANCSYFETNTKNNTNFRANPKIKQQHILSKTVTHK